jgi:hypothetical protein
MAIETEDPKRPVEYDNSEYMAEWARQHDESSPLLGMADDIMQPTEDPQFMERSRGAAKAQAFGDVMSSIFDTAVSSAGGIVEKDDTGKNQLRILDDYNRERARILSEKGKLKQAQLQDKINSVRFSLEEKRIRNAARLRGYETKAEKDWLAKKQLQADELDLEKTKIMYDYRDAWNKNNNTTKENVAGAGNTSKEGIAGGNNATRLTIAEIQAKARADAAAARAGSGGKSSLKGFTDRSGASYQLGEADVNAVYDYILQNNSLLTDVPGISLIDATNNFDLKLPQKQKENVVDLLYQHPAIFEQFKKIHSNAQVSAPASAPVTESVEKPKEETLETITETLVARISPKAAKFDNEKKTANGYTQFENALIASINASYPGYSKEDRMKIFQSVASKF